MSIDLSVIVVNYNTKKITLECINSVRKFTKNINYEIIVIDNASAEKFPKSRNYKLITNSSNVGFGGANNQGIKAAKGRYVLFLNSDTILIENSFEKIINWINKRPDIGAATTALIDKNKHLQTNGGNSPNLCRIFLWATFLDDIPGISKIFGSYHLTVEVPLSNDIYKSSHELDWVAGAVLLVKSEVINMVGGFDNDIFMYGEDVEYCYRIRKGGWKIWYFADTKIVHLGSASSAGDVVNFSGTTIGKESGIIGEFRGLQAFYKKHYPKWHYLLLSFTLKLAAILRILLFGIMRGQRPALKIYAEAFKIA